MNAIERYERARQNMILNDRPIPHQVLRDYLDLLAATKRYKSGLHNVTITVTKTPAVGLLDWDLMLSEGIAIRVEGQKWDA